MSIFSVLVKSAGDAFTARNNRKAAETKVKAEAKLEIIKLKAALERKRLETEAEHKAEQLRSDAARYSGDASIDAEITKYNRNSLQDDLIRWLILFPLFAFPAFQTLWLQQDARAFVEYLDGLPLWVQCLVIAVVFGALGLTRYFAQIVHIAQLGRKDKIKTAQMPPPSRVPEKVTIE